MSKRISRLVVLTEDQPQQSLVRQYLKRCGFDDRSIRFCPLPNGRGSGEQFVRQTFPVELRSCRAVLGRKSRAILIVMIDADRLAVDDRRRQLFEECDRQRVAVPVDAEPVVMLIPRRHVETWVFALLGIDVDEMTDYTKSPHRKLDATDVKKAADELYLSTRPGQAPSRPAPPSLIASIPEWQKIG